MSDILNIMQTAARAAGQVHLKYFRKGTADISHKTSHQNIVTQVDQESQDLIQNIITEGMVEIGYRRDEIGFVGEEDLQQQGKHTFIIDPLDGTSNFADGFDYFCTSIAYADGDRLTAGTVYRPTSDEMYYAYLGEGAYKDISGVVSELKVTNKSLQECFLVAYINSDPDRQKCFLKLLERMLYEVRTIRMTGAFALDMVLFAENIVGIGLDCKINMWDMAAGYVIAREAGGWVGDLEGGDVCLNLQDPTQAYALMFCPPQLKGQVLEIFSKS